MYPPDSLNVWQPFDVSTKYLSKINIAQLDVVLQARYDIDISPLISVSTFIN